jgi:hypothetical protein
MTGALNLSLVAPLPGGRPSLDRSRDRAAQPAADIAITWHEHGGPSISVPGTSGFGSVLIGAAIPGASVKHSFERAGVKVVVRMPLSGEPLQRQRYNGHVITDTL